MTFDELLDELPNGFHDAGLLGIEISYLKSCVILYATINATADDAEQYVRDVKVTLSGVVFFAIDPPDQNYPLAHGQALWTDAGAGAPSTSQVALPALPPGTRLNWIFVNEWNAFIRFASETCCYEWTGEKRRLDLQD
jgi:hypothetical protein